MANVAYTLTRSAYTEIADAGDTVNLQLPHPPYRLGNVDRLEVILATSTPTVPSNEDDPHRLGVIMENTNEQFTIITQLTVPAGEKLYARWLGTTEYDDASDLYVVTF